MAKTQTFVATEGREFPTLALTLEAGDTVDLPVGTELVGLEPVGKAAPQDAAAVPDSPGDTPPTEDTPPVDDPATGKGE